MTAQESPIIRNSSEEIVTTTPVAISVTTVTSTMSTPQGYPPNCVSMRCQIMFNSNDSFKSYVWRKYYEEQ